MIGELVNGRPDTSDNRQDKEMRVYDMLDSLGIEYQRVDHEPADNMEVCSKIDATLNAVICKNLFLCNRQMTKFYLLMIANDKQFKTKELSHQINSSRLSFATAEYMERYLDITPGSVSVLGLMNDTSNNVRLLIDEDVVNSEYVGCHPCVNTSSVRIKVSDLLNLFLPAVHHDYLQVKLVLGERKDFDNYDSSSM